MPAVNTEAMSEHLRQISLMVAPGAHALVVCDGAGWHQTGERLCLPNNISLLRLPPYAPELNPMEIVWAHLRSNKLANLVWDSYDDMLAACADAWRFLTEDLDRIHTIGYRSWASVSG